MSKLVLVVEDDPIDLAFISEALDSTDDALRVHQSSDGAEAIAYLQGRERPDLIITDLRMPRMDGVDLIKMLKSDPRLNVIPTIVLSTSNNRNDVHKCYSSHANAYFLKPDTRAEYLNMAKEIAGHWLQRAILPTVNTAW